MEAAPDGMRTKTVNFGRNQISPMGVRCPREPDNLPPESLRLFFFSLEELRSHLHVHHVEGEAKFWLEPEIELAQNYGLTDRRLSTALELIRRHRHEIRTAWKIHFRR